MRVSKEKTIKFTKFVVNNPDCYFFLWLFLLCLLCYGLLIPLLGFYWDDIPYLYLFNRFGPAGFPDYVASDRPFSAWIFMLTTSLFGYHAIWYHLLAFFLRFISAFLFFKIADHFWRQNKGFSYISASLFLVYPGFQQQPIALIYNHHLSVLCLFLLSVWLMVRNASRDKPNLLEHLISLGASLHMFSIENFATLELIRPFLIFIALLQKGVTEGSMKKTLRLWLPYLAVFVAFLFWRTQIFKFPTYQPGLIEQFSANPLSAANLLISRIPVDFVTITVGAWTDSLFLPSISTFGRSATILFWLLVFITFMLAFAFYTYILNKASHYKDMTRGLLAAAGLSLFLFLLAGSIVWALNLPLKIVFAWDRMTLAFIPATAILFTIVPLWFKRYSLVGKLIFSILISAAVGSHFQNNMAFKRDGENFQDFLWQLSWRMPALERHTTIIGSEIGLRYFSDNTLTPALNLIYASGAPSLQLDYLFYFTEVRLGLGLPALEKNLPIKQSHRNFYYHGSTSNMVAVKYHPPACLHVMDPLYSNSITNPNLSERQVAELLVSNIDRIRANAGHPPPEFLAGAEPEHSWCYYFQKADLARQIGQYDRVVELGQIAFERNMNPRDASEWLPFLEGYIRTGDWQGAQRIADFIATSEGNYTNGLCYTLRRIHPEVGTNSQQQIEHIIRVYNCS